MENAVNNSRVTSFVSVAQRAGFLAMSLFIAISFTLVGCGAADEEESSTVGLQGPAGDDGATGATGPAGPQGPAGPAGPAGTDGKDGKDGIDGKDGKDAVPGKDGKDGKDAVLPFELCSDDEDCVGDEVCNSQGICVPAVVVGPPEPECSATKPCNSGYFCGVGGTCAPIVVPPECSVNADCLVPEQYCYGLSLMKLTAECKLGVCQPAVGVQEFYCAYGCQETSTTTAKCLGPVAPECTSNADCAGDLVCSSGSCVECATNGHCDDGDVNTSEVCTTAGNCVYTDVTPPAPVTCRSLTLKSGFQFFGLVADPAANGEPIGEWAIFPTATVTWCGEKVFAFNVATDNAEGKMDWVLYGTQDANGNTCPEAAQSYPQGMNYVLTDVFQGSLPAELGCVRRCTTGGWVNWVCQSPK